MNNIDALVYELCKNRGDDNIYWYSSVSQQSIDKLEMLLSCKLPESYKKFLAKYGGGGVVERDICGIIDDTPDLQSGGSTYYETTVICPGDYGLPQNLVVIYRGLGGIIWCLDVSKFDGHECPVVSFDFVTKKISSLYPTFNDYLIEYCKGNMQTDL